MRRSDTAPLLAAASELDPSGALRVFVASYAELVDKALYSGDEPGLKDAQGVQVVVGMIRSLVAIKRGQAPSQPQDPHPSHIGGARVLEGHL